MNGGWRGWLIGALMAMSMGVGGWYGKTVWATQSDHAQRITRVETKIESIHETLVDVKRTLERVDRRMERVWEKR